MEIIANTLKLLTIGEVKSHSNLSMVPLIMGVTNEPDYIVLDEALANNTACVREVSQFGSVPELLFENKGDTAVLLLDGEELVGAKQNRIINLSILVPAKTTITVPVSCVEAGRWAHNSRHFHSEDRAYFAAGRARKSAHITESLHSNGTRHSRQGEIWNDISGKASRMNSVSDTDAMSSIYKDHSHDLQQFVSSLQPVRNQCGAIFLINNEVCGLDLFDSSVTFEKLSKKLIRSYALDALDVHHKKEQENNSNAVNEFINHVSIAKCEIFSAVGDGDDVRISGNMVTGGALILKDHIVHICAFPANKTSNSRSYSDDGELSRSSQRRRHHLMQ